MEISEKSITFAVGDELTVTRRHQFRDKKMGNTKEVLPASNNKQVMKGLLYFFQYESFIQFHRWIKPNNDHCRIVYVGNNQ